MLIDLAKGTISCSAPEWLIAHLPFVVTIFGDWQIRTFSSSYEWKLDFCVFPRPDFTTTPDPTPDPTPAPLLQEHF